MTDRAAELARLRESQAFAEEHLVTALCTYHRVRTVLMTGSVSKPGPELRRLEAAILVGEPEFDPAARRVRRAAGEPIDAGQLSRARWSPPSDGC